MSESLFQPDIFPDRYESGTPNVPAIAGLLAGARFVKRITPSEIGTYERELTNLLAEDLSAIKGIKIVGEILSDNKTGVLSIVTPTDCISFAELLFKNYGICVRAGLHCAPLAHKTLGTFETGTVRFSPGIFTTRKDIKKVSSAVSKCLKET